jgi:hypothetical protein
MLRIRVEETYGEIDLFVSSNGPATNFINAGWPSSWTYGPDEAHLCPGDDYFSGGTVFIALRASTPAAGARIILSTANALPVANYTIPGDSSTCDDIVKTQYPNSNITCLTPGQELQVTNEEAGKPYRYRNGGNLIYAVRLTSATCPQLLGVSIRMMDHGRVRVSLGPEPTWNSMDEFPWVLDSAGHQSTSVSLCEAQGTIIYINVAAETAEFLILAVTATGWY